MKVSKPLPKMDRAAVVALRTRMIEIIARNQLPSLSAIECVAQIIRDADAKLADASFV